MPKLLLEEETFKIIGACMKIHRNLGNGFLESVYQEVLAKEFDREEIPFRADFVCYDKIILEIKSVGFLVKAQEAQVINYLKATKKQVGLLINFGQRSLEFKRFINTT